MNNTQTLEQMRVTMARMRTRITSLDMEISSNSDFSANGERAFGTLLLQETNKILDCALDLSKQAATLERAVNS